MRRLWGTPRSRSGSPGLLRKASCVRTHRSISPAVAAERSEHVTRLLEANLGPEHPYTLTASNKLAISEGTLAGERLSCEIPPES
jgi:hypothetical protein